MTLEFDFSSAFHHTNLVIGVPFATLWPFVKPILSFRYNFQSILVFHHSELVILIQF